MKIDLAKIDSQIKKLEEIRRLASDPETLSLLENLVVNGSGPLPQQSEPHRDSEAPAPRPSLKEGTQVAAIAHAALASQRPFSGYDLAAKMQADGYKFHSSKPGLTVTDVLRNTLIKRGVVRIHKKGRGSEPMLFERVLP